jgi:diadenosine tetraphosphate (Ap4A) HIT family hydrolase
VGAGDVTARETWMPLEEWQTLLDGTRCPICKIAATTQDTALDLYVGLLPLSAVRLSRNQMARGYTLVYCRRHVIEPFELAARERRQFFADVLTVAEALQRIYRPLKLNYQILGNSVPHLHCHIMPRYYGDPAPHAPLPESSFGPPAVQLGEEEYAAAVRRLREELRDQLTD